MKKNILFQRLGPYGYVIPALLVFSIFLFFPFFKTIYLSLYKTNKMGEAKIFVGLGNYMELLTSSSFYNSLAVTLIFVVIVVIGGMSLGLLGAVLTMPLISYKVLRLAIWVPIWSRFMILEAAL